MFVCIKKMIKNEKMENKYEKNEEQKTKRKMKKNEKHELNLDLSNKNKSFAHFSIALFMQITKMNLSHFLDHFQGKILNKKQGGINIIFDIFTQYI